MINKVVEFKINKYYKGNHDGVKPTIENIVLTVANNNTIAEDLISGKVDLANKLTWKNALNKLSGQVKYNKLSQTQYGRRGLTFLSLKNDSGITADFAVRQALAQIVDRNTIIKKSLANKAQSIYGYYGQSQDLSVDEHKYLKTLLDEYPFSIKAAQNLLVEQGWTLDENGETYRLVRGKVRYKQTENGLVPLKLTMAITENNPIGEDVYNEISKAFAKIGGEITLNKVEQTEFFSQYYRQKNREYDIMFLGSNFGKAYDPSITFAANDKLFGEYNTSAFVNEELSEAALNMLSTQPYDFEGYQQKWEYFQVLFVKTLPLIPLFSSDYVDVYNKNLKGYQPDVHYGWAQAIQYASFAEDVK